MGKYNYSIILPPQIPNQAIIGIHHKIASLNNFSSFPIGTEVDFLL